MDIQKVHNFLNTQKTCVIARVNKVGGASAATVGFSHDNKFQFLIATNKATRKYSDMTINPKVALVIGIEGKLTVQFEGNAKEKSADELGKRLERHYEKVPGALKYAGLKDETYFLISPLWLRYCDMNDEANTLELKEFQI